ncbi:aminotransferase class I/II-fold pyridoxal phosphate-dependent enzyme [Parerythrobacter aestuarii]|uniref:aminotransferase class I/II-fold pyridoxal phosphate-dependent enzyme n=1 Tax=Parerythrobacter aestuarii TaxID=3020909 RepID=UPI0024DE1A14|nr:aminotransferase class I/II-fold pyridoxal phosphate-dependent enzyme [Parerythrobacter aestuarii]
MERRFSEAFADYVGVSHCIPMASGSSALVAALAALDIGVGDEVIVPGLTWVAPAVAVTAVNAVPVPVDVDKGSLCIASEAIEAAITPRTKAIIIVHLYASTCDIEQIKAVAERYGIYLIEDCAQSHGTIYAGQKVGGHGHIGIFSMHQGKPLTSGEGGAACTNDPELSARLEQLRANGRRHRDPPARPGEFDLVEIGDVLGTNMALSEFQAALLLDGLARLDEQIAHREAALAYLEMSLGDIDGVGTVSRPEQVDRQSVYHFPVRFDPESFGNAFPDQLAEYLTAELGLPWACTYPPMNRNRLWRASEERRHAVNDQHRSAIFEFTDPLSNCAEIHRTTVIVHHRALLAEGKKMEAIPAAFRSAREHFHSGRG